MRRPRTSSQPHGAARLAIIIGGLALLACAPGAVSAQSPSGTGAGAASAPDDGTAVATPLTPVFELEGTQRGSVLRGVIANAGVGATTTIDVTARRRDLSTAKRKPTGTVRLRRLTRTADATGAITFAITLDIRARRALTRSKRLVLTVRSSVRGPRIADAGVTRTRRVTMLPATARGPVALPRATVAVRDDFFTPRAVTIRRGGTVTWDWARANRPHNVVGPGFASAIRTSGTYRRTFTTAGVVSYACTLHRGMSATITVR